MSKVIKIINQIRLQIETYSNERVVDKVLVSVANKYETKISSLEYSKDLSKITKQSLPMLLMM